MNRLLASGSCLSLPSVRPPDVTEREVVQYLSDGKVLVETFRGDVLETRDEGNRHRHEKATNIGMNRLIDFPIQTLESSSS